MPDTKLVLNEYENSALKEALQKHIDNLNDQIKGISNTRYSSSQLKKEVKRSLTKKINLLSDVHKRL